MKTLLTRLFIENWPRKLISLILAIIIWMLVSHSITTSKTIPNIPVRVANLPPNKTIEGMQINGLLDRKVDLTIVGRKSALNEITSKDLEILIDAKDKNQEWIATIDKSNLISLSTVFDAAKQISRIEPFDMIMRQSNLITEKIPITVTQPIGEAPRGYQFLDVYPYHLSITVTGPEDTVKQLKSRGLKLTFNLSDISREELDAIHAASFKSTDEIAYFAPKSWKKISLPQLSDTPVAIDDPRAQRLRLDFSKQDLLPISFPIPVTVFFPPQHSKTINPETYSLAANDFLIKKNGIKMINAPLYTQGVSNLFLETVKDMIQITIIASPKSERDTLLWSPTFMYPNELENRYVSKVISESSDVVMEVQPHLLEDYLRNRFRNYMNRFRLYTPNKDKLSLKIELQANSISVTPVNYP